MNEAHEPGQMHGGRWYRTFLVLFMLLMVLISAAQDSGNEIRITIQARDQLMREVLDRIEEQSGLSFAYNSRLIEEDKVINLSVENMPLEEVLHLLFPGEKISYNILEKQIVLKKSRRRKVRVEAGISVAEGGIIPVKFTISGYVKDAVSGEVLIGATISIPGGITGTISNSYGFFSLTLERRPEELKCSYVGYRTMAIPVKGTGDQMVQFNLEEEVARLSEVTIYSNDDESRIRTARSSEDRIRPDAVRKMPALFGEKDVIKSLASVPGVKFFGDGSTIFYVRGGGRDQNLITIDEAPVYNPTHLLGFFSTVVPDAVKDIKIYKGDFPANYGGRLSSLIDIRTKDGNMKHFGMDGSVGLLSSRLSLEGPIWKDHISFFVSGRRSYITKFLQNFSPELEDLHFSDLHLKLNYKINSKNRIFISMYSGVDNYETRHNQDRSSGINWQNSTATLRWNHLWSDRLFSNLTLLGSRYDYYLNQHIQEKNYWNSHIDNLSLKYDFSFFASPAYTLRFGVLSATHFHNPGNYYRGGVEFDPGRDLSVKHTREYAGYVSNQFIFNENLSLRAGIRLTSWQNIGPATEYEIGTTSRDGFEVDTLIVKPIPDKKVYHNIPSLDPRLSLVYQPARGHNLKWSYSRTSQFQYLITNSISPFTSLEVWLPAGPNVPAQVAHQFTLGYSFHSPTGISFETEGYYKRMNHLIDYRDHARMLMNPLVEYELRFGKGDAYGVETQLKKEGGRLTGWLSYTWSRSYSRIEGINGGHPYPSYSDRPHDFSFYLSWALHRRLTLTGNFTYMTGAPFSTPTSYYYYDNHQVPVYASRNNDRLPDYHRLDLALNWHLSKAERRFQHELIFSVYNLYNRKNPVALHFNKIDSGEGSYVVPTDFYSNPELVSTQFWLYGIVPSISYHFHF